MKPTHPPRASHRAGLAHGTSVGVTSRVGQQQPRARAGNQTLSSSHMRIQRWIPVLAAVTLLPAGAMLSRAAAQGITTGAVGGLVSDTSGGPLAGVQIQVR